MTELGDKEKDDGNIESQSGAYMQRVK